MPAGAHSPWPTPIQEQILTASFAAGDEARHALEFCSALPSPAEFDGPALRLLPLLHRRWSATNGGGDLLALAQRLYLTTWQQNRERMSRIASLLAEFEKLGIECMLLKGAALALRHYRDYGLRSMGDFDLLVHRPDAEPAVRALVQMGWIAEKGCTLHAILRQAHVRHAWQFSRGANQDCDLHWRPLARCHSPQVTDLFWQGAETVQLAGHAVKVPSATDQLFHVCVHAQQWNWVAHVCWVADALTVLRDSPKIDWDRVAVMGARAAMRMRLTQSLAYLSSRFHAPIPAQVLAAPAPKWEQREYALLLKPCPLGFLDSVAWHMYHFRRLRPFDERWRQIPAWAGFPQYLAAFLDAPTERSFRQKLWAQCKLRARWPKRPL